MIEDDIKYEITRRLEILRKDIEEDIWYEIRKYGIKGAKENLQIRLSIKIDSESKLLFGWFKNYLIKRAIDELKSVDITLKDEFYRHRHDFMEMIEEWAAFNWLVPSSPNVKFGLDPRLKNGVIASGVVFVLGVFLSLVNAIIAPLTIIAAAIAYVIAYKKSTPQVMESIKNGVRNFLSQLQKDMTKWLLNMKAAFEDDLAKFCREKGFEFSGELK